MRVTERMIFESARASTTRARDQLQGASEQVSSGRRVTHPADDPGAAGLTVAHKLGEARYDAILKSTSRANDELSAVDSALDGVSNLLSRARELAVQFANSTYSADQRKVAAEETDAIIQNVVSLLNTRVDDRYVFGGNIDNAPPFDASGNYLGDTGIREIEIAPGVHQAVSVRADEMIKGTSGGTDGLATLQALSAALQANDIPGIQATLEGLDDTIGQVANTRARAGTAMSVLDAATVASRSARDAEKVSTSNELDVDAFEATSKLALSQRALEAALTASSESFGMTLLDKLR